jgi:hypothetical protein
MTGAGTTWILLAVFALSFALYFRFLGFVRSL